MFHFYDDVSAIAFTKKGGLKDPTIVAYKGVAPIKTNLIKGDIDVGVLNLGEALTEINEGTLCVSIVLANNRMAKIGDSPTATELGIPVSLSTVRGFVTKKGAPAERVKELEAGMLKAMSHNYYKNFLTEIGLDETSVVGAEIALAGGLELVMDKCIKIEHARFHGGLHLAGFDTGVIDSRRRKK